MSAVRTTIERSSTDLRWCERQLRNPDDVTWDQLDGIIRALREVIVSLEAIDPNDLPAEQAVKL